MQYHMPSQGAQEVMSSLGNEMTEKVDGISVMTTETVEDLAKIFNAKEMTEKVLPDNVHYTAGMKTFLVNENDLVPMFAREG